MRYPDGHKKRTRARIVDAASRLFRRQGYDGTSVSALMGEAGLTHGGFYAHFRDKAELLEQALQAAFAESRANLLERGLEALRGEAWLRRATRRYLTLEHVERPDEGCAIPALGAEVARAGPGVQRAFAAEVEALVEGMSARLEGSAKARRAEALRRLTGWVGALLLARAVGDEALAREILAAAGRKP